MKTEQKYPEAISLDFHGTLVEEDDIYVQRICKTIADASGTGPTEIEAFWNRLYSRMRTQSHGDSFQLQKDIERLSLVRVLEEYEVDLDPDAITQALFGYWLKPQVFPEAVEVVSRIRVPICLLSNIDNEVLSSALAHTGFVFEHIVTSESCRSYKPRAEMFEAALAELGLGKEDVLHVGDSVSTDVVGAKRHGIRAMWINRKNRTVDGSTQPDYISADLTGILGVLAR